MRLKIQVKEVIGIAGDNFKAKEEAADNLSGDQCRKAKA